MDAFKQANQLESLEGSIMNSNNNAKNWLIANGLLGGTLLLGTVYTATQPIRNLNVATADFISQLNQDTSDHVRGLEERTLKYVAELEASTEQYVLDIEGRTSVKVAEIMKPQE